MEQCPDNLTWISDRDPGPQTGPEFIEPAQPAIPLLDQARNLRPDRRCRRSPAASSRWATSTTTGPPTARRTRSSACRRNFIVDAILDPDAPSLDRNRDRVVPADRTRDARPVATSPAEVVEGGDAASRQASDRILVASRVPGAALVSYEPKAARDRRSIVGRRGVAGPLPRPHRRPAGREDRARRRPRGLARGQRLRGHADGRRRPATAARSSARSGVEREPAAGDRQQHHAGQLAAEQRRVLAARPERIGRDRPASPIDRTRRGPPARPRRGPARAIDRQRRRAPAPDRRSAPRSPAASVIEPGVDRREHDAQRRLDAADPVRRQPELDVLVDLRVRRVVGRDRVRGPVEQRLAAGGRVGDGDRSGGLTRSDVAYGAATSARAVGPRVAAAPPTPSAARRRATRRSARGGAASRRRSRAGPRAFARRTRSSAPAVERCVRCRRAPRARRGRRRRGSRGRGRRPPPRPRPASPAGPSTVATKPSFASAPAVSDASSGWSTIGSPSAPA